MFGLVIGLVAILLGTATACVKHRCIPVTFGIVLTPVWIILFIAGAIIAALLATTNGKLDAFCTTVNLSNSTNSKSINAFEKIFGDYADDIDDKL